MYNVNASLIREVRMIATRFFETRPSTPRLRSVPTLPSLLCNLCLHELRNKPKDAVTIVNGQAVCMEHRNV